MGTTLSDDAAKPTITVVIPAYRSSETLPSLIERLEPVLSGLAREFEVVIVNDGSPDGTWETIRQLSERFEFVRGINLMRNYGQHNALLCGVRAARFDLIVTIDDDLQNPPEEIPKLAEALDESTDVVYGYPEKEQHGLLRNIASQLTKIALQKSMGAETARRVSALRLFRTEIRQAFAAYNAPHASIDVLLSWGAARFKAISVRHDARTIGKSGYTLHKLITHAFNMITGFSVIPLQIASYIGFFCTLLGVGIALYVLVKKIFIGGVLPGFTFLAASIAIFSGAQLLSLGIIGEYIARIHFRIMDQPTYTVRSQTEERERVG